MALFNRGNGYVGIVSQDHASTYTIAAADTRKRYTIIAFGFANTGADSDVQLNIGSAGCFRKPANATFGPSMTEVKGVRIPGAYGEAISVPAGAAGSINDGYVLFETTER
jgi:hypothetical protein